MANICIEFFYSYLLKNYSDISNFVQSNLDD